MNIEKPPRRWFVFSLRTMFVVLTIFACWLGWELRIVRQRQAMLRWVEEHGGHIDTYDAPVHWVDMTDPEIQAMRRTFPAARRLFGDQPIALVLFEEGGQADDEDIDRIVAIFPEAFAGIVPPSPAATPPDTPPQPKD